MHGLLGSIMLLKLGDLEWLTMSMNFSGIIFFWCLLPYCSNQPKSNRTSTCSCECFASVRPPTHSSCLLTQKPFYPSHPHLLLKLVSFLVLLLVGLGECLGLLVNLTLSFAQDKRMSQCLLPCFFLSFFFSFPLFSFLSLNSWCGYSISQSCPY